MLLQRLEALPVGSFHYKLLVITGLGWLFDAIGYRAYRLRYYLYLVKNGACLLDRWELSALSVLWVWQ